MWGGFDGMWGRAGISFLKPGTTMNMERYMATQESTFKVSFLKQVTLDLTLLDGRFHAIVEKYSHLITSIPWSSRKASYSLSRLSAPALPVQVSSFSPKSSFLRPACLQEFLVGKLSWERHTEFGLELGRGDRQGTHLAVPSSPLSLPSLRRQLYKNEINDNRNRNETKL